MQKTLLSSTAVLALTRMVNQVANLHIAHKSDMLQAHTESIAVLAEDGHVQELQPVIAALDFQIASLNVGVQPWIITFEKRIKQAKSHFGNGGAHKQPQRQPQRPTNARPAARS